MDCRCGIWGGFFKSMIKYKWGVKVLISLLSFRRKNAEIEREKDEENKEWRCLIMKIVLLERWKES